MGRLKKRPAEGEVEGAPEWMVTFSDCMTLLLTFFVLLLSFAGFADETLEGIGSSFANALPSVAMSFTDQQDSMWEKEQIIKKDKVEEGSETKTLSPDDGANFMKEKRPLDFRNLKVFTIPSAEFFYGNGIVLSKAGEDLMDQLGTFLLSMPTRVVISENGPDGDAEIGLQRAWAVLEYLASRDGLDRGVFSITGSSTMLGGRSNQRMLEITLLEREVFE